MAATFYRYLVNELQCLHSNPRIAFMAATSYRYLVNLPGVCQGKTIVEGTRIGVHDVVGLNVNFA
jgi:hypothetical protein